MSDRRKVLYFIAYPQRLAGANRSLYELITHLPPEIDPLVVTAGPGLVVEAYQKAGVRCLVLPAPGELATYGKAALKWGPLKTASVAVGNLLPYTVRLARLFRRERVDIVHCNDPRGALIVAAAVRLTRKWLVVHHRGEGFGQGRLWRFYERLPDRVITVCRAIERDYSDAIRPKVVTVYNGIGDAVPAGEGIPALDSLRSKGVCVVSCFATLVPFKAQHHLLDAAGLLRQRGLMDRFQLVVVGDTPRPDYLEFLKQRVQANQLDNVTITGWIDNPFSYYRSTDISCMASVSREQLELDGKVEDVRGNEGFPRTHLEAMLYGLPVIGSDIAGVSEQVEHGVTGLVVPPGNPAQLADAIGQLVLDPELRRRMGQAGKERVARLFSTEAYVRGVMAVYDGLK